MIGCSANCPSGFGDDVDYFLNPTRGLNKGSAAHRKQVFQGRGLSFLLSQVGSHSSRAWTHRMGAIGLQTRSVMLAWNIARVEGRSQRELAKALGLPASRVVNLVDELEAQGLIERRVKAQDRRTRALYLTAKGRRLVDEVVTVAIDADDQIAKGLTATERRTLIGLLTKVAAEQGLIEAVHPGF